MDHNLLRKLRLKQSGMREGGEPATPDLTLDAFLDIVRASKAANELRRCKSLSPELYKRMSLELNQATRRLQRFAAIVASMTQEERTDPAIITESSIRRIAAGSGNDVEDVANFVRTFNQSKKSRAAMKLSIQPLEGCSWSWLVDSRWSHPESC